MQRYFDHHSLLREVVGHRLTALSGPRALLVMAAHPVAFAGFFAHTGALADPYGRLRRTARVMDAVAFGTAAQAERMTAPVRQMHTACGESSPSTPAASPPGRPTAATIPSCCCGSWRRWRSRRCSCSRATSAHSHVTSSTSCGSTTGRSAAGSGWRTTRCRPTSTRSRPTWPTCTPAGSCTSPSRRVSWPRRRAAPGRAAAVAAGGRVVNQVTIGLLPSRVRRLYRFRWDPVRALAVRGGAEVIRRLAL